MSMEEPKQAKPWWQSITIWSGVFMLISSAGLAGVNIDFETGDFDGNIYVLWASIGQLAAGAAAIFGRVRASVRIGK